MSDVEYSHGAAAFDLARRADTYIAWEVKNRNHTNVPEKQRRVPDIICMDPYSKTVYIIHVRTA
jgi:hypothetical protein